MLKGLVADAGLPLAVYFLCRALGLAPEAALALGAGAALLRILVAAAVKRRFNALAALVAGGFAVALALTLLTGDPRFLLAKESIVSGLLGLVMLGSCLAGRPLFATFGFPGGARVLNTLTLVWGIGLLAESLLRIPLVYRLPIDVMTAVSPVLQLATVGLLLGWTLLYRRVRVSRASGS